MIDATRIETQEAERPDLSVVIDAIPAQDGDYEVGLFACPTMDRAEISARRTGIRGGIMFRLPGTRREKLTKALMEALAELSECVSHRTVMAVRDAYAALLAIAAKDEQERAQ